MSISTVYANNYKLNLRLLKQILEQHRPSHAPVPWFHKLLDPRLPKGASKVVDNYGNIFVLVGDCEQSDVAFTSHLDTVARLNSRPPKVKMTNGGVLYVGNPDVADCLGADCGAGIYLMLEMLEAGIPGRYCFFLDEEVGCEGSSASKKDQTGFWTGVKAMISFDRRGDGVITKQRSSQCCSDTFALELSRRLGRGPEHLQSGVYTDSAEFTGIIPECTNVGVGYNFEHTPDETLDLNILGALLQRCLDPWTFRELPIERDPVVAPDLWGWANFELPPAPTDVLYVGTQEYYRALRARPYKRFGTGELLIDLHIGGGVLGDGTSCSLSADDVLQLAHDLRRMAMDIKRKEKSDA